MHYFSSISDLCLCVFTVYLYCVYLLVWMCVSLFVCVFPARWRKWLWPCRTLTWEWRWETRGSLSLSFHTPWQVCVCVCARTLMCVSLHVSVHQHLCVCMCEQAHCSLCLSRRSCIMQQWVLENSVCFAEQREEVLSSRLLSLFFLQAVIL